MEGGKQFDQSVPESVKLLIISNYFDVSLDYLMKESEEQISVNRQNENPQQSADRTKWVLGIIFGVTIVITLLYIIINVYSLIAYRALTSFPWWSAFYFAGIQFGPFLFIEGVVYGLLYLMEKRTSKKEEIS